MNQKKFLLGLILLLCAIVSCYAQPKRMSVPEFAERLMRLDKKSLIVDLTNKGFRMAPESELLRMGYDCETTVVGFWHSKVGCIAKFNKQGIVDAITVNNIEYPNARYVMNDYQQAGYILDEDNSSGVQFFYVKDCDKYYCWASIGVMINPYGCMTRTEFRRVNKT